MGWKVKGSRLDYIRDRVSNRGGLSKVRWELAQCTIHSALEAQGRDISKGLNLEDFQILQQINIISDTHLERIEQEFPTVTRIRLTLSQIKDGICNKYRDVNLGVFLDEYLNISSPKNTNITWKRFRKGEAINYQNFCSFCEVLGENYWEVGESDRPLVEENELKNSLLFLDHQSQLEFLEQANRNFIRLRIHYQNDKTIAFHWLFKWLINSQIEPNLLKSQIDFTSSAFIAPDYRLRFQNRLQQAVSNLSLPKKSLKNLDQFAESTCKKLAKTNKNLLFVCWVQIEDSKVPMAQAIREELQYLEQLWQVLVRTAQERNIQQQIIMVWLDKSKNTHTIQELLKDSVTFATNPAQWQQSAIGELSITEKITQNDVQDWLNNVQNQNIFSQAPLRQRLPQKEAWTAEEILSHVYQICGYNWEEYKYQWLSL